MLSFLHTYLWRWYIGRCFSTYLITVCQLNWFRVCVCVCVGGGGGGGRLALTRIVPRRLTGDEKDRFTDWIIMREIWWKDILEKIGWWGEAIYFPNVIRCLRWSRVTIVWMSIHTITKWFRNILQVGVLPDSVHVNVATNFNHVLNSLVARYCYVKLEYNFFGYW